MALVRDLIIKRVPPLYSLIKEERKKLNLKAVKGVLIQFDPFRDESAEIRKFANLLYAKDSVQSNPKCIIKTEILTDRSEETVKFELTDGKQFIFKCANLKCLEIFQLMNEHITPLAPVEESNVAPKKILKEKTRKK